jgi:uncharacterized protein (UPF0548 family)
VRLVDLAGRPLTYAPVGATLEDPLPTGYRHVVVSRRVGNGAAAFRRASEELMTFGMHRHVGLRPRASRARAATGVDVLSRFGPLPVPCRVVWTLEEEGRTGFGYGTLAGHPEQGEEGFLVERRGGEVWAVVRGYSRPATRLARLGGPVTRLVQDLVTRAYLRALARAARG